MTITNLWTDGERLLALADSAMFGTDNSRTGHVTKILPLPLVPGIIMAAGNSPLTPLAAVECLDLDDAELVADRLVNRLPSIAAWCAKAGAPLVAVALIFAGWSLRRRRMVVHRFTRVASVPEFVADELTPPVAHTLPASPEWTPPVDGNELGNIARMIDLARWQHDAMRKRDGRYQSGGQLIAAQVTSRGVMLEQVGDLG